MEEIEAESMVTLMDKISLKSIIHWTKKRCLFFLIHSFSHWRSKKLSMRKKMATLFFFLESFSSSFLRERKRERQGEERKRRFFEIGLRKWINQRNSSRCKRTLHYKKRFQGHQWMIHENQSGPKQKQTKTQSRPYQWPHQVSKVRNLWSLRESK